MGEDLSARTQRELADLRGAIDRDVDALLARAREDIDPRNLVRRNPLAAAGAAASVVAAAALAIVRKRTEDRGMEKRVDELIEAFGGRISKLRGKARDRFRKELRKELAEAETGSPKQMAWHAGTSALTASAMALARVFVKRLAGE